MASEFRRPSIDPGDAWQLRCLNELEKRDESQQPVLHTLTERVSGTDEHENVVNRKPLQEGVKLLIEKSADRLFGILDVPTILVFGIILYLVDTGSDILAAINHFQEGNSIWGSLTITFVVLPALCWAAASWALWYECDPDPKQREAISNQQIEQSKRERKTRMLLSILLLDPLIRYLFIYFCLIIKAKGHTGHLLCSKIYA